MAISASTPTQDPICAEIPPRLRLGLVVSCGTHYRTPAVADERSVSICPVQHWCSAPVPVQILRAKAWNNVPALGDSLLWSTLLRPYQQLGARGVRGSWICIFRR
ncbi:hypothetical protein GGTG_08950 [Gaeumannomyces tritici R3-111a-1]|uniref:Uncharacterized protein n=1 Tax=Gaeumannomyces tritici (strain R3-111a-1) TaxID=644352 RepID=J3P610_GAET3|nr:hypothetical protein GGTG_08950 [Gaeumannomyces tritici R3-111a-1]EJT75112.1 hypothetical protein GGTG_08950 [Gaeumannomyces tritici R3-111a-1]